MSFKKTFRLFFFLFTDGVNTNMASEERLEEDALMEANLELIFNMDLGK